MDVDVGKAEISVDQQDSGTLRSEGVGEGDGEPGLADAALAGGDGEDAFDAGESRRGEVAGGSGGWRGSRQTLSASVTRIISLH